MSSNKSLILDSIDRMSAQIEECIAELEAENKRLEELLNRSRMALENAVEFYPVDNLTQQALVKDWARLLRLIKQLE